MNHRKTFLFLFFLSILVFPSLTYADGPYLNIPPTNAFDKIHSDNGTINAVNFSMPFSMHGDNGVSIKSSNKTHTVTISGFGNCSAIAVNDDTVTRNLNTTYHNLTGKTVLVSAQIIQNSYGPTNSPNILGIVGPTSNPAFDPSGVQVDQATIINSHLIQWVGKLFFLVPTDWYYIAFDASTGNSTNLINTWIEYTDPTCGSITTTGTYRQTLANNTPINTGGNRTNYINGTGNPIHLVNDPTRNQVNVTISSTGGLTSINSQAGPAINIVGQTGNITITNSTNQIQIGTGTNIPILNGKNQTFLKPVAFTSNATRAGLTIKPFATIPTNLQDGDLYHLATQLRFKNGANDRLIIFDDGQQTMVNKIFLSGGVSSLADATDNTKRIQWLLSGMTASKVLTLRSNQTTSQGANIPNLVSTDTFMMQVAQNQTSDANAITNIPITNHHCAFYFVTGNSTFRNICNFNGGVHVLSKG